MDLNQATAFRRKSTASFSCSSIRKITRSPPTRKLRLSRSSPLSDLSSQSPNSSIYLNYVKGHTEVSSTSASLPLAKQSYTTRTVNNTNLKFSLSCVSFEGGSRKRNMYDPFHPSEGEDERMEGEGEKYDPFDPTGSPASENDNDSGKVRGVRRNIEKGDDQKDEERPDSTDTLPDLPNPGMSSQLHLRRRVDCSAAKTGRQMDTADSDHSEIEEGEIVGVTDKDRSGKNTAGEFHGMNTTNISFFSTKPERILRVLDGDGFVSVREESSWEVDREAEEEPVVGVEDLRRKLVSRRKERYLSFPASSLSLSPQPLPPPSHPPASPPSSPLTAAVEQVTKLHKTSKVSKDCDRPKNKERKGGEKEERKKKRKKDKEGARERSKEKERGHKSGNEVKGQRSSRSSSRKRKKRRHSSPEASRSCNSSARVGQTSRSFSSLSDERQRERERGKDRDKNRTRERDREKEREKDCTSSHRGDERDRHSSSRKREKERKGRHSSSRERGVSKRSRRSSGKSEGERDEQRERDRRRTGRSVVPPSIQDLNGSDLFAIKRTITVTTTTTTTTVPGSPRLAPTSPCRLTQDSGQAHKRKKKKKKTWNSAVEGENRQSRHSHSKSLSPPRYHSYESDRYSDKLEIDVLSLDGEALDSDYPSLEDTPPANQLPEPPAPSPKIKTAPKAGRHHPKKKFRTLKKIGQSESSSSSSNRTKSKCLSSHTVTSGSASVSSGQPPAKRVRKMGKDKERDKANRKDAVRSGKSKKESSSGQKGKLQSKVSVLVREGVSSTTGTSVGTGKLGMDLLGPGGTGGGSGSSVVGGSIAVVFCRDNESRSPFLKPCSEPLSLGGRNKDLGSMGKRSSLAAPPSSLTSLTGLKSKKTKPSSITSTSSSASSPSSTLITKRRRRLAKKTVEKGVTSGLPPADGNQAKAAPEGWGDSSLEVQSAVEDGSKSVSPHPGQADPTLCSSSSSFSSTSSSSSSTSVLPPSSSPPHTPPPSMAPLRDTRESSPDSQTVDSSCKTPDPPFLPEDCPSQTSPALQASSPSSPQRAGLSNALSTPTAKPPPPDDASKSLASPPCSSSSAGCGLTSLSSLDPSSSSSVSSSCTSKPPPPPPAAPALPWSLQTGVDCTTGGVLALTALLFKMEEANIASRAKAQEFIQATSQILSQANQSQSQQLAPPSSASSIQIPPPPSLPPPTGLSPAQFILHSSLPLVSCTKTPPSHLHPSIGTGCAQTPPPSLPVGLSGVTGCSGDSGWDNESKDPDKYLKKLHTQERAVEEVKLAIKPYYQRKDINKDEYKDILRKAVHKICHSRTGEINPVKVSNLVKLYVQRYKYFRKHGRKMDEEERDDREPGVLHSSA
ncbi:splicing factor, arginine/serine-rich 19 [Betta splendens]|uniref:Splicing factor, arginine/serine-rich 19 n=1 Tax=Betta splendens TaxID=158456 RepID=A0A6P7N758_BETSP|nr:splicing factor, arginine/serine-rich 19 [Betta splendens]